MSSMTAEQRDRLTARRFDAAEPSARPKRSRRGALIALAVVAGGLFLTNPDEDRFVSWASNIILARAAAAPAAKNVFEEMGRAAGMAMMPGWIRTASERTDYGLFSIYTGRGVWKDQPTVLGIGGRFIPLAGRKG